MNTQVNKIVWAYLLERGHITNGEWSYYSGDWEYPKEFNAGARRWDRIQAKSTEVLDKIKTIGVDWAKTKEPTSSMKDAFADTFSPADNVETLLGTLVLNDGSTYMYGANNADVKFGEYVRLIAEMAVNEERVKSIFGET